MKYMWTLVHGNWSTSRQQRYIAFVGENLPDYTDMRWSSACDATEHGASFLVAELKWLHGEAGRKEEKDIFDTVMLMDGIKTKG